MARALMIQGTGSDVGKSVLVCGLCRVLHRAGVRVAPFKSQNMALNSYVTADGLEMGRAQVAQAEAARLAPRVEMNPILLKPSGDAGCQVVLMGKPAGDLSAMDYHTHKTELLGHVRRAYERLAAEFDVILIEGAGSPAEINLRETDIVNMRIAEMADAPVLLVVDIDRGGAFAWVAGTLQLLEPHERARVKGVIINKFRGDVEILKPGLRMLEDLTSVPVVGVVPFFHDIRIDAEDSVCLDRAAASAAPGAADIAVVRLPRLSNFTDFDALALEPGAQVRYVRDPAQLGRPDVVILPGSKNTPRDLQWLRETGFVDAILRYAARGGRVVGVCGGFQMLGEEIADPLNVEAKRSAPCLRGLGLLPASTTFLPEKTTHQVEAALTENGRRAAGAPASLGPVRGYEIHMGVTRLRAGASPFCRISRRSAADADEPDGAIAADGRVWGTYLHGLFDNDELRFHFINLLRGDRGLPPLPRDALRCAAEEKEANYDRLADLLEASLDMDVVWRLLHLAPRGE